MRSEGPRAFRTWWQRLVAGAALAAPLLVATTALADDQAARLFDEGRSLMLSGRYDEACPKLAESQRLDPHVGTLLNLAACHEKQGKVASAWVEYQKGLTAAKAEGQAARVKLAEERIGVLERRVPWLTVVPPLEAEGTSDVELLLDGSAIARAAWGKEMPVDPGPHVVELRAPGRRASASTVDLREGDHRSVPLAFGEAETPLPEPAPPLPERVVVEPKETPAPVARAPEPTKPRSRWIFEPGLYLAAVSIHSSRPMPSGSIQLVGTANSIFRSCGSDCEPSLDTVMTASIGVNAFLGYAVTDRVNVGLRGLLGPNVTRGGGSMFVLGPTASVAAVGGLRLGLWLGFGDATTEGYGSVSAPGSYALATPGPYRMKTTLNGGFGVGLEIGWELAKVGDGALVATAMPLFVPASQGSFWAVPVGLSYRF